MTPVQKWTLKLTEARGKLADALESAEPDAEEIKKLTLEVRHADEALTAAKLLEPETPATVITETRPHDDKLAELRESVNFGDYIDAALVRGGVTAGASLEYNRELGIPANKFDLALLAPKLETRAAINGDTDGSEQPWLDRVMAGSRADYLGVTFRGVAPGVAALPTFTAGADAAQRGRAQSKAASTFTLSVTEHKPTRMTSVGTYSIEDAMRVPGLVAAIRRDMLGAVATQMDKAIFEGDDSSDEDPADIAGFNTLLTGAQAKTLTQVNKVKAELVLGLMDDFVDGVYAYDVADLRIVTAVPTYLLWGTTIQNSTVSNETVAQFLRAAGATWTVKNGLGGTTGANALGFIAGLPIGIEGAAVASVWQEAQFLIDEHTDSGTGEIDLILNTLWAFSIPRTANFAKMSYVA